MFKRLEFPAFGGGQRDPSFSSEEDWGEVIKETLRIWHEVRSEIETSEPLEKELQRLRGKRG